MSWLLLVLQFLILKSILSIDSYDFGYHPSAEEYDNLMRDTSKTWTRKLIAKEAQRRSWTPKYKTENLYFHLHEDDDDAFSQNTWPAFNKKVDKPTQTQSPNVMLDSATLGSTLDFSIFSGDATNIAPGVAAEKFQNLETPIQHGNDAFSSATVNVPPFTSVAPTHPMIIENASTAVLAPIPHKQSTVLELDEAAEDGNEKIPVLNNKYSINNLYKNNSEANFPLFFTNPVTNTVYAITEVGKLPNNTLKSNDTIPIYITKEQYDRDMFLMHKEYEKNCYRHEISSTSPSVVSEPIKNTVRPQIIRLKKPTHSISKLPTVHLPITNSVLHKPPPVMVQTGVTVSDQVSLPSKRKTKIKKKKTKKKKKPNKRPGKHPSVLSTTTNHPPALPHIVLGTRTTEVKPSESTPHQLSTQLEKPSLPSTIFSSRPFVTASDYMRPISRKPALTTIQHPNHRMKRRSVTNVLAAQIQEAGNDATSGKFIITSGNNSGRSMERINSKRKKLSKRKMRWKLQNYTYTENISRKNLNSTKLPPPTTTTTTHYPSVNFLSPNSTAESSPRSTTNRNATEKRRRKDAKKQRQKLARKSEDDDYYFDLFDSDSSYDDEDDDYYFISQEDEKEPPSSEIIKKTDVQQQKEDTLGNSSSAEEGADYGALEEEGEDKIQQAEEDSVGISEENSNSDTTNTKDMYVKKRIRRRPPLKKASDEYDDEGDSISDSGVGGFFRMIFYPVQAIMSTLFGTDDDSNDGSPEAQYPIYTLYNDAAGNQKIRTDDYDDEDGEQANSFSSWFNSWFGFNRKTKKIGSTTTAVPPQKPAEEEAGWFESLFGFGGKTTTTATIAAEDYSDDEYDEDKFLFGWFDSKPKAKRKKITTTTTTPLPQVPILTIVDPLKNPQNWIGILAQHIINSTTSTHNPLIESITRATTTTTSTDNPDIPKKIFYDKYQIWRLRPQDAAQVKALEEYKKSEDGAKLNWLKGPSLRGLTDVLVPPKMLIDFQGSLNFEAIDHEVMIFDVGKSIAYEKSKEQHLLQQQNTKKNKRHGPSGMSWNKYHNFENIIQYLELLSLRQPQIIELIDIGSSYEGRPLVIVKIESKEKSAAISAATQGNHKKLKAKKSNQANAVFIESGAHGNEWVGPAAATWMINELLRIMKNNQTSAEKEFIKNTTWYIMPLLNPDGYVYSQNYDRFWRKSRSRHVSRPNDLITSAMTWLSQKKKPEKVCYGVDLDQNWQYNWGKRGSSKTPCNEFYAGPVPFSEPETKALSDFLADNRKHVKLYVSMQAYGQIISYPFKANASFSSERMDDFFDVAMVGVESLRKNGDKVRYKVDSARDLIEKRSGSSHAYAAYDVGVPFSYMLQLADNGVHGYLLPSTSIETTAQAAFEMITAMMDYI